MEFPEDLKYTREHEWARKKGANVVIGITEFAQDQLGDVVFVELPSIGDPVKKGESFGVVESTKAVSELFAPLSGKVVEVNDPLTDAPETINEDPYEEGWMITIQPSDPAELDQLMDAKAYKAFVEEQD
jgi:glycine cleavage system H protein